MDCGNLYCQGLTRRAHVLSPLKNENEIKLKGLEQRNLRSEIYEMFVKHLNEICIKSSSFSRKHPCL